MKSKTILPLTLASLMILLQPAWAGPYTSKSQNAAPSDSTVAVQTKQAAPKKFAEEGVKKAKAHPMLKHGGKRFMKNMSDEDRARFQGIREKLRNNADVKAAREAMKSAEGPEAKRAAFQKLREARRAAMSEEDRAFMDGLKAKMKDGKDGEKCQPCTQA